MKICVICGEMIDKESKEYKSAFDKALKYFSEGKDEKYIALQLAEDKVSNEIMDAVVLEIKKANKKGIEGIIGEIFSESFRTLGKTLE